MKAKIQFERGMMVLGAFALLVTLECVPCQATIVAQTGFNDDSGINSDGTADSPYELNATLHGQGSGEAGWGGPWEFVHGGGSPPDEDVRGTVQTSIVHEGDGAARFESGQGTDPSGTNSDVAIFDRPLGTSYSTGIYTVDYTILLEQFLNDQYVTLYFASSNAGAVTIEQNATAGTFSVIARDGDGGHGASDVDTGVDVDLDTWYKFSGVVDLDNNSWDLYLDGSLIATDLGFRDDGTPLDSVRVLVARGGLSGGGATDGQIMYLDEVVISEGIVIPEPATFVLTGLGLALWGLCRRTVRKR